MAHAYTPGLSVTASTTIRSERRLPLKGEVLVQVGDKIQADDVVARAHLPGNVQMLNVANLLSLPADDVREHMLKTQGESIKQGEVIATTKGIFGLFKSQARAPIDGTIESISDVTGQVIMREPPIPVDVKGYVNGVAVEVMPDEGVILETYGTYIQGIFGIGGEVVGLLEVAVDAPEAPLLPEQIQSGHRDKILVGGAIARFDTIQKAIRHGVKGLIIGGIADADLRELLGYELGVAITGTEEVGLTLIVTEGFGQIPMAKRTFELLKARDGLMTSMNGATQIRAGVVRPEIIIPLDAEMPRAQATESSAGQLDIGTAIRIIREPYFGKIGHVIALPVKLQTLETEAKVRVLEAELEDGQHIVLPRANVELIEM